MCTENTVRVFAVILKHLKLAIDFFSSVLPHSLFSGGPLSKGSTGKLLPDQPGHPTGYFSL